MVQSAVSETVCRMGSKSGDEKYEAGQAKDESARHNNELEQADAYSRISFAFSAVMPHISAMDL